MDETAFQCIRAEQGGAPCPFAHALGKRCAACSRVRWMHLAEREIATCSAPAVATRCRVLCTALHEQARFALRIAADVPWPFGKEIRAQCGGLLGLQRAMHSDAETVTDVAALVLDALAHHGSLEDLPYSEIMRSVVHYVPRPHRR